MTKNNRNIFQSIKKDIFKGFKRIFWFSYTRLKYHYFSLRFFLRRKNISKFKISILLPTRERSKKFQRMLNSLIDTCSDLNRIEILLLIDEDDKESENYRNIIKDKIYNSISFKLFEKSLETHAIRNNFLATQKTGEIIFPINDDMIFVSKKWDEIIDEEFSKLDNENPYCLWISSDIKYSYLHSDYPIINQAWYKRLGYVGSEYFNFWYLDTWICSLSHISKKFLVTNKITVKQFSADTYENEVDNTFLLNRKDGIPEKDLKIWNNTKKERLIEAKKLL